MRPLNQYNIHKSKGMSFRKDVILDMLSVGGGGKTVQELMDYCVEFELGSQATLHREIHELIDARYIMAKKNWRDRRVVSLRITPKGKQYLEKL